MRKNTTTDLFAPLHPSKDAAKISFITARRIARHESGKHSKKSRRTTSKRKKSSSFDLSSPLLASPAPYPLTRRNVAPEFCPTLEMVCHNFKWHVKDIKKGGIMKNGRGSLVCSAYRVIDWSCLVIRFRLRKRTLNLVYKNLEFSVCWPRSFYCYYFYGMDQRVMHLISGPDLKLLHEMLTF